MTERKGNFSLTALISLYLTHQVRALTAISKLWECFRRGAISLKAEWFNNPSWNTEYTHDLRQEEGKRTLFCTAFNPKRNARVRSWGCSNHPLLLINNTSVISLIETGLSALHWHKTKESPPPWFRPLLCDRGSAPAHFVHVSQIRPHNTSFPCCTG